MTSLLRRFLLPWLSVPNNQPLCRSERVTGEGQGCDLPTEIRKTLHSHIVFSSRIINMFFLFFFCARDDSKQKSKKKCKIKTKKKTGENTRRLRWERKNLTSLSYILAFNGGYLAGRKSCFIFFETPQLPTSPLRFWYYGLRCVAMDSGFVCELLVPVVLSGCYRTGSS